MNIKGTVLFILLVYFQIQKGLRWVLAISANLRVTMNSYKFQTFFTLVSLLRREIKRKIALQINTIISIIKYFYVIRRRLL